MDCDQLPASENPKHAVSYKDAVMSVSDSKPDEDLIPIDDDDIDLLDEDVRVGVTDGVFFIDFSSRVQDLAIKSFEFTLVLKILGRRVGYTTLYNRLISIWNPSKPIKLIDIENNYFLVKFSSRLDHIAEKSSELDPNLADTLAPHRLLEPYGPWMLVENRRRRPAKSTSQLNQYVSPPIATTSSPAYPDSESRYINVINVMRQRDINVMPRKESTGVVSTISASKKSSLDPSKHSALTTSVLAFPIVITRDNQQQGPSCSTNVQPNLQTHGDHERLRTAATSFFASMFDVDDAPLPPFPFVGFFPPIAETTSASLTMLPQEAEIKATLFDMAPLKAPGLDGIHAHFYQSHWDVVKPTAN
ncbi:hypothetical protein V6N11_049362 [Hibiscus sabdariffa]|uniref:DUF4283 domain-containing protein n=1 Tax=Hibiscus sabdariffa TaxID=183260 RepID=A0ABR2P0X9_9ROSI